MDQTVLVEQDKEAGSELLDLLSDMSFPVTLSAWIHDAESTNWKLALATPLVRQLGKRESYRKLHAALATSIGNPLTVDRVVLLDDSDPALKHWSVVESSQSSDVGVRVGPATIGGTFIDEGFLYSSHGRAFHREVFAALQRVQVLLPNIIIRRAEKLYGPAATFDFLVSSGSSEVAVEAKGSRRPLERRELDRIASGALYGIAIVIVSRTGFARDAAEWVSGEHSTLWLVRWRSPDDDPQLVDAIKHGLHLELTE